MCHNIVAENHTIQDSPFDEGNPRGSICSSRSKYFDTLAELSFMYDILTVPLPLFLVLLSLFCVTKMKSVLLIFQ